MTDETLQVSIRILDKEYRIGCAPDEQQELRDSARLLDTRMRAIRQTGRVIGTDRIAVMAALNIAHELIQIQHRLPENSDESTRRLRVIQTRVARALASEAPVPETPAAADPDPASAPVSVEHRPAERTPAESLDETPIPLDARDKRV